MADRADTKLWEEVLKFVQNNNSSLDSEESFRLMLKYSVLTEEKLNFTNAIVLSNLHAEDESSKIKYQTFYEYVKNYRAETTATELQEEKPLTAEQSGEQVVSTYTAPRSIEQKVTIDVEPLTSHPISVGEASLKETIIIHTKPEHLLKTAASLDITDTLQNQHVESQTGIGGNAPTTLAQQAVVTPLAKPARPKGSPPPPPEETAAVPAAEPPVVAATATIPATAPKEKTVTLSLGEEITILQREIHELKAEINKLNPTTILQQSTELQALVEKLRTLKQSYELKKNSIETLKKTVQTNIDLCTIAKLAGSSNHQATTQLRQAQAELKTVETELSKDTTQLKQAQAELKQAKAELRQAEDGNSTKKAAELGGVDKLATILAASTKEEQNNRLLTRFMASIVSKVSTASTVRKGLAPPPSPPSPPSRPTVI